MGMRQWVPLFLKEIKLLPELEEAGHSKKDVTCHAEHAEKQQFPPLLIAIPGSKQNLFH